uniref:Uncharacterized protein n=1 Tax=Thermosphaera aggregans TaxID=54254 RepID=A0A7C2FZ17_9CREN
MSRIYRPRRTVIVRREDPCKEAGELKNFILYSLIISHGIRVDTDLLVSTGNLLYQLSGSELRHLHAQEESILGFVKTVFCRHALPPGVRMFTTGATHLLAEPGYVLLTGQGVRVAEKPQTIPLNKHFVIADPRELSGPVSNGLEDVVKLPVSNMLELVIIAHYVLDRAFGAWVRRHGRIEHFNPARL